VSSGTIHIKGSKTRWDTVTPSPSVLTIDPASLKIFYPEQRSLEIYSVSSGLSRLAATPLPRLKVVREQFWISECKVSEMDNPPPASAGAQVALLLLPKSDELKKYVRQVRVLLDADGDRTVVCFKDARINTGLTDAELELSVPDGTRISRPLEAGSTPTGPARKDPK
jgi:outer membrane lipoprotein-sorting protein